jgi:hypothetical protein
MELISNVAMDENVEGLFTFLKKTNKSYAGVILVNR